MITKWQIENFKSAYDQTELELKPITIFAGANSSGKSTFIQSILLVAQTLTSRVYSRPVVLNGHIARLGSYSDLASANSKNNGISIGFTCRFPEEDLAKSAHRISRYWYGMEDLVEVGCDITFSPVGDSPTRELSQLQPKLTKGKLWTTRRGPEQDEPISFQRSARSPKERADELCLESVSSEDADALEYEVISPASVPVGNFRYSAVEIPANAQMVGVNLFHFVPSEFTIAFDATEHGACTAVRQLTQAASEPARYGRPPQQVDRTYATDALLRRIFDIAKPFVDTAKESAKNTRSHALRARLPAIDLAFKEASQDLTVDRLVRFQRLIDSPGLRTAYEEQFKQLVQLARGKQPDKNVVARVAAAPSATRGLQFLFTQLFKYLGPLRDEPKPVYPMEGAVDPSDVGLRGEFTAAVLDLHKSRRILAVPSAQFAKSGMQTTPVEMSLQEAVLDWLNYLGVVSSVETTDKGVFGHELRVAPCEGDTLHNLVHVGVGVSQVLPILVMSLMADFGSVLVFEQPELHLHPRVQTLLADFMLSMALLGKQCIIETHSEYFINRLRLRVAEDSSDKTQEVFALYFVEKDGPKSRYRTVGVNEYGAMSNWPAGFFDQAPQEAERILRAAFEKRKNRRLKNA